MERKLASVKQITAIEDIPWADRIQIARITGWQSVIRKDSFRENDIVIFIEIDSILPDTHWSSFLKDPEKPDKPIRLKTCKLKGVLSQGLVVPVDIVPEEYRVLGADVTQLLGITKYEPPVTVSTSGKIVGNFPTHLFPKTDSERIQNLWTDSFLTEINNVRFTVTHKMDGTSFTVFRNECDIGICSRNFQIDIEDDNLYSTMFKQYSFGKILKDYNKNIAIQMEIIGEGIQKNTAKIKKREIRVFDVYDIDAHRYYNFEDLVSFCKQFNLPMVTIHTDNFVFVANVYTLEYITEMTNLKYENTNNAIEGLVFTAHTERYSPTLQGRLRFKMINPNYLLKNE